MKKQINPQKDKSLAKHSPACRLVKGSQGSRKPDRDITCFEAVPALTAKRLQSLIEQHLNEIIETT